MILIYICYLILLWSINAWHDADYKNKKDAHFSGALLVVFIIIGFFILNIIGKNFTLNDWDQYIYLAFVALVLRRNVFDPVYNKLTNQPWNYIGETAALDKWRRKHQVLAFVLNWICLFLSICMCLSWSGIGINY